MARTLLAAVIGVLVGAAAMRYWGPAGLGEPRIPDRYSSGGAEPELAAPRPQYEAADPAGVSTADKLAVLERAAAADVPELRRSIERAAASSARPAERYALRAYLARYAEIDADAALRFALALDVDAGLLDPVFRAAAARDPAIAIEGLRALPAAGAEAMARVVLAVLGDGADVRERVLTVLPNDAAARIRIDALVASAEADPEGALRQVLSWTDYPTRNEALGRLAADWALRDPRGALAAAALLDDRAAARRFRSVVLARWSAADTDAVLDYFATADVSEPELVPLMLSAFANVDPARLLEVASRLPRGAGATVLQMAVQRMAEADPAAAAAAADALPLAQRRQVLGTVATQYGLQDPDGALEWVRRLDPPMPELMVSVLGGIGRADLDRALSVAASLPPQERPRAIQTIAINTTLAPDVDTRAVADRLLAMQPGEAREQTLGALTSMWASRDPEAALEWLLANDGVLRPQAYASIARRFAQRDPEAAATYTMRLPPQARAGWVNAVGQSYARLDPQGALGWLAQFRGQPEYEAAVVAVAQGMAQSDPVAAARLVSEAARSGTAGRTAPAAVAVASQWAAQDPRAAAQWALDLPDRRSRASALTGIAGQWAGTDRAAATAWAVSLPAGADRDAVLLPLVAAVSAAAPPDERLLRAFSTDAARRQAVQRAVLPLARRDPAAARAFADRYVTDPAERRQVEQMLEAAQQQPSYLAPAVSIGQRIVNFPQ